MENPKVISETIQEFRGIRYYRCGDYFQNSKQLEKRLHRVVWIANHGNIPADKEIHHKDHDRTNNQIENLELLSGSDHARHHALLQCPEKWQKSLAKARESAKAWHKSEEGKAWHVAHGKAVAAKQLSGPGKVKTCQHCGAEYVVKLNVANSKYCSNNCKSAARRAMKKDNVEMPCLVCGTLFLTNKYEPRGACSKECRARARSENIILKRK
ncbi:MAG: HNH endonuclease [Sphaerospermopsis sp. SIO1G2]|nr:HNH endonuclease [Sphaerospermopsis sp. SIO1G2]